MAVPRVQEPRARPTSESPPTDGADGRDSSVTPSAPVVGHRRAFDKLDGQFRAMRRARRAAEIRAFSITLADVFDRPVPDDGASWSREVVHDNG